ncbi:hypothetical protein GIB67_028629 [Kingdonia uniflora]|uniref:SHSP domain-containing protein n=1 Tax=Kingdonia uniflora TaxID=39325 RepID=A0A7J7KZJ5_9MAGN|nr:hypothetical protein GIB67_028629 [Kingdonia uniflora]
MDSKAKAKAKATITRSYEEFEPLANWVREETNTLEVQLPGYKKEQLRVQLDNIGNLKISGERPLEEENKWSRFHLNFHIAKNHGLSQIQAKFVGGVLFIILPKKTDTVPTKPRPTQEDVSPQVQETALDHSKSKETSTDQVLTEPAEKISGPMKSAVNDIASKAEDFKYGFKGLGTTRLNKPRRVVVIAVAVVAVVVAIGVLTAYKLRWENGN